MDIFAHTLWANAVARGANKIAEKKSRRSTGSGPDASGFHINGGWTAFWGVFPDLFAFSIPFFIGLYKIISGQSLLSSFRDHHNTVGGFDLASYFYQFSHSLIIFLLVFILIWILFGRPRYELLGWVFHILIDIPSHNISFFPTPFLFPISEYRFSYGVHWSNQWYMLVNYIALLVVWGGIIWKKYSKKNLELQ